MSDTTQETGNQTVESQEVERDPATEALFEQFGLPQHKPEQKDVEFPKMDEPTGEVDHTTDDQPEDEQKPQDKRTLKLKYNGEEKEVDEEEARNLAQKGMNYDKVQQRLKEQQDVLDRTARLQGFKDHAELVSNLDRLEKEQLQRQQDQFKQLRQQMRDEYEEAGLDPSRLDAWLDNHPVLQEANRAIQERQALDQERAKERESQRQNEAWHKLYATYPDLVESSQAFTRGETPEWFTSDMKAKIEKGYDPIDAYELVHRDKLQAQSKKAAEQRILREQQLGLRGHVSDQTATAPEDGALTPAQRMLAEEFGVDVKGVQRHQKLLQTRR